MIEKLEKDYEQLLINWTTITNYMKRIDNVEKTTDTTNIAIKRFFWNYYGEGGYRGVEDYFRFETNSSIKQYFM